MGAPLERGREARPQSRVGPVHLLAAASVLGLLVMPVALAEDRGSGATKSASITKQIRKLKKRVAALEARKAPASLPPSGPAAGDLIGTYPNPLIAPNAVGGAEIDERAVPIPTAWAVVSDPGGNTQPAGDPHALALEGVQNITDGDGGDDDDMVGLHCYELGFTPDLILATARGEDTIVTGVQAPADSDCGASANDAKLNIESISTGNFTDGGVHIGFFDLE